METERPWHRYRVSEVATKIGVPAPEIRRWVEAGVAWPAEPVGKGQHIRFAPEDLPWLRLCGLLFVDLGIDPRRLRVACHEVGVRTYAADLLRAATHLHDHAPVLLDI
jgi:DNA-binding transcriptional MerR regulator